MNFDPADIFSRNTIPQLNSTQLADSLDAKVNAATYALGLNDSQKWSYDPAVAAQVNLINNTSTPSTSTSANITSIPKVNGAISKDQFFNYLNIALQKARTDKWMAIPDWNRNGALYTLVVQESNANPTNKNPGSTAYGLFQFLDSTWADTGISKNDSIASGLTDTNAIVNQIVAGIRYVYSRYQTPENALMFDYGTIKKIPFQQTGLPLHLYKSYMNIMSKGGGY